MQERRKVTKVGIVVSDKMDKTIVVKVQRQYNHDENNECKIGDTVQIAESRPLSREKKWRLDSIIERSK